MKTVVRLLAVMVLLSILLASACSGTATSPPASSTSVSASLSPSAAPVSAVSTSAIPSSPATPTPSPSSPALTMGSYRVIQQYFSTARPPVTVGNSLITFPPALDFPPGCQEIYKLCIRDVARLNGIDEVTWGGSSTATSVEVVEFNDTSLGFPDPGKVYPQVVTPGFIFRLNYKDVQYTYHTDKVDRVVLVDQRPAP